MKLLAALVFVCLLAVVHADETKNSFPIINASANEPVNISAAGLRNPQSVAYDVSLSNITGGPLPIPASTFMQRFFATPLRWLENGKYTYTVKVTDEYGNNGTGAYTFLVNASGQTITLLEPVNGGTNNTNASFVIQSEFPSHCKWINASTQITDDNRFSILMRDFTTSDGTRHTLAELFTAITMKPVEDFTMTMSVTCNSTNRLSSKLFYLTYITEAPGFTVQNIPNPIVDPADPTTTITVRADQEVWCTVDTQQIFGAKTIDNFRSVQNGVYRDTTGLDKQRNLTVSCTNRIGKTESKTHTISFNYTSITEIVVTSTAVTNNKTYPLTFDATKTSICTVQQGNTVWAVTPAGYGKTFTARPPAALGDSTHTVTISCDTGFQPQPTTQSFTFALDSVKPTLQLTGRPNSCSLSRVSFGFNATDATPSSGIAFYNYTVVERTTNKLVAGPLSTTQSEVTLRDLKFTNNTEYLVRGAAIDKAGNPSAVDDMPIKATDGRELSCDTEEPEAIIYAADKNGTIYATLYCKDNNKCKDASMCTVVPGVAKTCEVNKDSKPYPNSTGILITQSSTVCCEVSDLSGNTATAVKSIPIRTEGEPEPIDEPPRACNNGEKDDGESGVDCGGVCFIEGKLCKAGEACTTQLSCESGVCSSGKCATPSCTDKVKNGAETGVDCGGTCGACSNYNSCTATSDCTLNERCERDTCIPAGELEEDRRSIDDVEFEEPTVTANAFGLLNIILIVAGLLCMVGGGAYIVLYEEPKKQQKIAPPPRRFEDEPLVISKPLMEQTEKARVKKKNVIKDRIQDAIKDFDTPEELSNKENITHKDLEHAYTIFDADVFRDTTKKLLKEKKVGKHHVAIALADIASKKNADTDAIDGLRKEFKIEEKEEE